MLAISSGVSGGLSLEQAVQQEHVQQAHGARVDAEREERIDVDAAHLDVLDAALAQRVQRPLAGTDALLGPDRAVELVLDLQQAGGELAVLLAVADADRLVRRVGLGERGIERRGVAPEAVEADRERGLGVALVAQRAHAQRRAPGHVQRARGEGLQLVLAPGDEALAHRGRGAEQIQQQPGMAPEVADQAEVGVALVGGGRAVAGVGALQPGPGGLGQREVVMDARDGLHARAVAVREAVAVDGLGAADVRAAVAADRDALVRGQPAGHAARPQHLVAERAVDDLVDLAQLAQAALDVAVHAGDQLQLRLAEIGRDVLVGERRAEPRRVRRVGKHAVRPDAQAFLFDAAQDAGERLGRERA